MDQKKLVEDEKMSVGDQRDSPVSPELAEFNFDNSNPTTSRSFQPIEQPNTPRSNFIRGRTLRPKPLDIDQVIKEYVQNKRSSNLSTGLKNLSIGSPRGITKKKNQKPKGGRKLKRKKNNSRKHKHKKSVSKSKRAHKKTTRKKKKYRRKTS